MFSLPLSVFREAQPRPRGLRAEPKLSSQAQPPVTARVSAPSGQRRWTVVVPRRLTARAAQALADAEAAQSALPATAGPIRFRPQLTMFGVIATVASGLYVYSEKHAAASLDRQIAHASQATTAAHDQTSLLRAEWALLNNPDRLHPLADRYLTLQPLGAGQFAKLADLHSRLPKVLYGPPAPVTDEDAAAPPIVTKRLLAMAEVPAPPPAAEAPAPPEEQAEAPDQPAPTPVVSGPAHAFRVAAHPGAVPAIVDTGTADAAPADDSAQSGIVDDDSPKPVAESRPFRPAATPAWRPSPKPSAPTVTQLPAPKLLAHAEPPKPRPVHQPMLLRPELVHMLMMPHLLTTSTWTTRPAITNAKPQPPQRRPEYGRSDPPHFLSVPQAAPSAAPPHPVQQYAEAPAPIYRAAPSYLYRPYWNGYNNNPYAGYYYPQRPVYPAYQ